MDRGLRQASRLALALVLAPAVLAAQDVVQGHVRGEGGTPLANATVVIQGTRLGTIAGDDGQFHINLPSGEVGQTVTIAARLIGYREHATSVKLSAGTNVVDFTLEAAPVQLQGMVVVAEGQEKQKSQLGTSTQSVSADQLNTAHTDNFLNQLGAKVSGVEITSPGTQGGSVDIRIRGSNSITGDNNPLFVVDGIPIRNRNRGSYFNQGGADANGGWDYGSTISDINQDDIASITVLKGPNAAALYGAEAANGAVIITTKHGANSDGKIETRLTTSYSFDKVGILPDFQNEYGQGSAGQFSYYDGEGHGIADGDDQSYGPRLNGQPIDQFTGPGQPWIAHPNNVASFFNTGGTTDIDLSVSGGTNAANARMAVGVQNVDGVVPNNFLHKWTSSLAGNLKIGNKLTTNASLEFLRNNGLNRPGVGYNAGILEGLDVWFGRQVDMAALKANYNKFDAFGNRYNWNTNYHSNPYFLQYDNPQSDTRNQYIGSVSATYQITDWLSATGRAGGNIFNTTNSQDIASQNTSWAGAGFAKLGYAGAFTLYNDNQTDYTTTALLNATKQLTSRLQVDGLLAAAENKQSFADNQQQTLGISVPGIYNVSNAAIAPTLDQYAEKLQTNSVFGSASFTWDQWWTVEGTARNDWSSTLPANKNSYFYPSVNTSVILTNAIPSLKSNVLSYVKLRGAIAKVGSSAQPYSLATTFNGQSTKFAGQQLYSLADALANPDLKPEITRSDEVGAEIGLFGDRASIDMSYYDKATSNQIIAVPVSPTTGYQEKWINAGKITNKGFEALLNLTPVRTHAGTFEWNTTFSFAMNRSRVDALSPGIETIVLGSSWALNVEARKGQPYGALYGYTELRDSATGQLLLSGGLPQIGPQKVLGTVQPDWTGGWNNEFRIKNVTLSALLDIHEGGSIFSVTNFFGVETGVLASTLHGREKDWNDPGLVIKGIDQATGQPNTTVVTTEEYEQSLFEIHQPFVYKDSYIKLREVRAGIDVPRSLTGMMHVSQLNIAVFGRNLWTDTKVPNIDPEFAMQAGNFQGVEFAALPNVKSIGISLQVTP
ncbi:MAG TPA: SusC/RagA family TonB-linked outer membrane protein [Gemmatimonadaceae bacterium]|nr:SusC/RagA family TonB-linked outer membrane protein [Gemmatimonadaceae bacterium]